MDTIYLKIHSKNDFCFVPIETFITLFIIKYIDCDIDINFILVNSENEHSFKVDVSHFSHKISLQYQIPEFAKFCELPNIVESDSLRITAGLSAVLRRIIKIKHSKNPDDSCIYLLGFKFSCLLACSEVSVWTKFCEVDIVSILDQYDELTNFLPECLVRFERHMEQPVKLHNLPKYKNLKKSNKESKTLDNESEYPDHSYAEGPTLTLSDLIIFVCLRMFVMEVQSENVLRFLPFTQKWYKRMLESETIKDVLKLLAYETETDLSKNKTEYIIPKVENQSLYKSDQKKNKPKNKLYTKQEGIEQSLNMIKKKNIDTSMSIHPFGLNELIDRNKIPFEATPQGGDLPISRVERKYQQLENLCRPVIKLAKPGDVIVDFCSGSGHLGILIAYLLPDCSVILLENKEESLKLAMKRVSKMKLKNIHFCQSNLDYFIGDFDIGTSLHACGVATDLVIRQCIKKNAVFVCCPCCYGSIQDCHHITYPRSDIFRSFMDIKTYLTLGHAADQTHDDKNAKTKQGFKCMAVIDTDRKLHSEQFDYKVQLSKLIPPSCSPKNNLLVGVPNSRHKDFMNCF